MSKEDKQTLLQRIMKEYPNSIISTLDEYKTVSEFISTGSTILDRALGTMGVPMGRVVEFLGVESAGKTSIANSVIYNGQRKGYEALFVDLEFAYNKEFAVDMFGINPDMLTVARPGSAEDAMGIMEAYIDADAAKIIVLDSISSLIGEEEIEKDFDDPEKIGTHAKLVTRLIKRIVPACGAKDIMFIVINQLRDTIGYAPTPTGGRGLKCWKSVSIQFKPGDKVIEGDKPMGRKSEFTVMKNKLGTPYSQGSFTLRWGGEPYGIDNIGDVMDLAVAGKIIKGSKGWYAWRGLNNMRFKDLREFFNVNPEEFDMLQKECFGVE